MHLYIYTVVAWNVASTTIKVQLHTYVATTMNGKNVPLRNYDIKGFLLPFLKQKHLGCKKGEAKKNQQLKALRPKSL